MATEQKKHKIRLVKLTKPKNGKVNDYTAVLLEEVREQFKIFGEALESFRDNTEKKLFNIEEKLTVIGYEIISIKAELKSIKSILERKADRDYVEKLEKRIIKLETEFASLRAVR